MEGSEWYWRSYWCISCHWTQSTSHRFDIQEKWTRMELHLGHLIFSTTIGTSVIIYNMSWSDVAYVDGRFWIILKVLLMYQLPLNSIYVASLRYSGKVDQDGTPSRSSYLLDYDRYKCYHLQYVLIRCCICRWKVLNNIEGHIDVSPAIELNLRRIASIFRNSGPGWNSISVILSSRLR